MRSSKSRNGVLLFVGLAFILCAVPLAAQDKELLRGYRSDFLEVFLDRADLQKDREAWLGVAEAGAAAVEAAWEKNAALLSESGAALEEARGYVREAISREVERRFGEWVVSRFLERCAPRNMDPILTAMRQQDLTYLYVTDQGVIRRDDSRDPILKGIPGLAEERAQWRQGVETVIGRTLSEWRQGVEAAVPELLAEVPEEDRARLAGLVAGASDVYAEGYRRELDAIFQQGEARFLALRTYDQYSLRRKSEEATAGAIVDRLILQTKEEVAGSVSALEAGLQGRAAGGIGDVDIDSTQWLSSFKTAFQGGLARWDKAEESLLLQRVEWERAAGKDYRDGEQAWARASQALQTERMKWEGEIRRVLESGKQEWAQKEADLSRAISEASAEMDRETAQRAGSMSERVESLVEVYTQASAMLRTAESSGRYWLDKLNVGLKVSDDMSVITAKANPDPTTDGEAVLDQVRYWHDVWQTYSGYLASSRKELEGAYAAILSDDGASAPLKGILSGVDPASVYLDEYQVELLKARAVGRYWDEQYAIARSVDAYAKDLSSGRATEAEGRQAYESALASYGESKTAYDAALQALVSAGAGLADRSGAIELARSELSERRRALDEAQQRYSTQLAIYQSRNTDFFKEQLQAYYRNLLETLGYGAAEHKADALPVVLADYLSAARRYGFEQQIQIASEQISLLVQGSPGTGGQGLPSLRELREAASAIGVTSLGYFPGELAAFGVNSTSPYYQILFELFNRHEQIADSRERAYIEAQCAVITGRARAEAEAAVREREDSIRLLASSDAAAWCGSVAGEALAPAASAAAALSERAARAFGRYLLKRAEAERQALLRWEELTASGAAPNITRSEDFLAAVLSSLGGEELTAGTASARAASLDRLVAFLSADHWDLAAQKEELRALAAGDAYLTTFIGSRGCIVTADGVDWTAFLLVEEWGQKERAVRQEALYSRYALSAPGTRLQREEEARASLASVLETQGLLDNASTLSLKTPEAVWAGLSSLSAAGREQRLSQAAAHIRDAGASLPAYQSERLAEYLDELLGYAARKTVQAGGQAAGTREEAVRQRDLLSKSVEDSTALLREASVNPDPAQPAARILALARLAESIEGTREAASAGIPAQALRDRLTAAGAALVARSALAASGSPGQAPGAAAYEDAFWSVFGGAPSALLQLKEAIILQARRQAGIQLALDGWTAPEAMTQDERRASAYALWRSTDISVVPVSRFSQELYALWKIVERQAGEDTTPEEKRAEREAFRLGVSDEAAGTVGAVIFALDEGLRAREQVFLEALCGVGLPERLAAYREQELRGGAVLERGTAVSIARQLTGEGASAIFDIVRRLSGLRTNGAIDGSLFGAGSADVRREAFLGLQDNERARDAKLYYCKERALAGDDVSDLRASLDGAAREELDHFLALLRAAREYLPGIDPSEAGYARTLPGCTGAVDAAVFAEAVRTGAWEDFLFTARLASGPTGSGYLQSLWAMQNGNGTVLGGGILGELVSLAAGCLEERTLALLAQQDVLEFSARFRGLVETVKADAEEGRKNYRAYLLSSTLSAGPAENKPESGAAGVSDTADPQSILHRETSAETDRVIENEVLEAYNGLARAGGNLSAAFAPDGDADSGERETIHDFETRMAAFTRSRDPDSQWKIQDGYVVSADAQVAYSSARALYGTTRSSVSALEGEIQRLGAALEAFNAGASEAAVLTPMKGAVDRELALYSAAQARVETAMGDFQATAGQYNGLAAALDQAYAALESARTALRTQEQIHLFAGSGYLKADGSDSVQAGYRSPSEELAYTKERSERARAVLEALQEAVGDMVTGRAGTDSGYTGAFESYRGSYERFLALKKLQGELLSEIEGQEGVVAQKESDLEEQLGKISGVGGLAFLDPKTDYRKLKADIAAEISTNETAGEGAQTNRFLSMAPSYFVRLSEGQGLRLAYDTGSYALCQNTAEDWALLKEYMSGKTESGGDSAARTFQDDLREWISEMDRLLKAPGGSGVLARWGLAAGYVKEELYKKIGDSNPDPVAKGMRGILEDGIPSKTALGDLDEATVLEQPKFKAVADGWSGYIVEQGSRSLAAMSEDERKCFEMYLALNLLDMAKDKDSAAGGVFGFFADQSSVTVMEYLSSRLESTETALRKSADAAATAGFGFYAAGVALSWCPAGWVLIAESALLFIVSGVQSSDASDYQTINSRLETTLANKNSAQAGVQASTAWFTNQVGAARTALGAFNEESRKLAQMKGAGGEGKPSEEQFLTALRQMTAVKTGKEISQVSLDPALVGYLHTYFGAATSQDSAGLLWEIAQASERDKINAFGALAANASRAETEQADRLAEYRSVVSAFLAGNPTVGEAEVRAAGERAFSNPLFTRKDDSQLMVAMQQAFALDPPQTGNESFEGVRTGVLGDLAQSLSLLYQQRLSALKDVRETEWGLRVQELRDRQAEWQRQIGVVVSRGLGEWKRSALELQAEQGIWQGGFEQEYLRKSATWEQSYLAFVSSKRQWVDEAAVKAGEVGSEEILRTVGEKAEVGAREAASRIVSGMSYGAMDPGEVLKRVVGSDTLAGILEAGRSLNKSIASVGVELRRGVKQETGGNTLALVHAFQAEGREEMEKRGALILASRARESLEEVQTGYRRMVEEANQGFQGGMDRLYLGAGFTRTGRGYQREGVVGSTLLSGVLTERQEAAGYQPYAVPDFSVKVDLSESGLEGLSGEGIQGKLSAALEELKGKRETVFGADDERHTESFSKEDKTFTEVVEELVTEVVRHGRDGAEARETRTVSREVAKVREITVSWGRGEFGEWVGYAPVFVKRPDAKKSRGEAILAEGKGELGHLMGDYTWYSIRQGEGYAEVAAPAYDKPLWDDRGGVLGLSYEAPSLRTVADVGVGIAAACTGNVWLAAALNLADDALFGLADVAGGYKEGSAVALEFGKKAVVGFGTAAIGGVFGSNAAFGKGFGLLNAGGVGGNIVASTMVKGMELVSTGAYSAAVNAVHFNGDGNLAWDSRAFGEATFGRDAVAGYLGGMASTLTSGVLDTQMRGFVNQTYASGVKLDAFAGSLAGLGVSYAMTGEATLNVLNAEMFGVRDANGQAVRQGLLELQVGQDGVKARLGTNGTDVSIGTIAAATAGLKTWGTNAELAFSSQAEAKKYLAALRSLASTERATDSTLYQDIMSGRANVVEDYSLDATAKTVAAGGGARMIYLGRDSLDLSGDLSMGVVLSHEGYRNGIDDGAAGQRRETDTAVFGHSWTAFDLENTYGAGVLGGRMGEEAAAFGKGVRTGEWSQLEKMAAAYDASRDYWKLVKEGGKHFLQFDGQTAIYDEKDNFLIGIDGTPTAVQSALATYLGVTSDQAAKLMFAAGMKAEGKSWLANSVSEENKRKRISVGGPSDSGLTSYLFAAENHNAIMDQIEAVVKANPEMSREQLRAKMAAAYGPSISTSIERYVQLQQSMGGFYLGSGTVDDRVYPRGQQFGLVPTNSPTHAWYEFHTGYDAANPAGTPLTAPWSGIVEESKWSDSIGNTVSVTAGYQFEGLFMEAGFSYGDAHMSRRDVTSGPVTTNQLLGLSGNLGTMVLQPGFHNHFTIYNENYGHNRFLSDVLGLGDSNGFDNGRWKWQYDANRRFYDPRFAYEDWFRR